MLGMAWSIPGMSAIIFVCAAKKAASPMPNSWSCVPSFSRTKVTVSPVFSSSAATSKAISLAFTVTVRSAFAGSPAWPKRERSSMWLMSWPSWPPPWPPWPSAAAAGRARASAAASIVVILCMIVSPLRTRS